MDQLQGQDVQHLVLLGTFGMLLLVGGIGAFVLVYQRRVLLEKHKRIEQEITYQNKMIKLQLESQEHERMRIGSDLHDSLGSLLWGAKVNAAFIQRSIPMDDAGKASYQELTQILDESIEVVRRISWELTPEAFHLSGLSESVAKLIQRLDGRGIDVTLKEENSRLWNDHRALQVFRIIQESVSNAVKHSGGTLISISMIWTNHCLEVTVADNGGGLKQAQDQRGVGLWNIDQRVKQLGAEIRIGDPPIGPGTEIKLKIPWSHE